MNVSIGDRWKSVISDAVDSGAYASPEDVMAEALRLFAREQAKLAALKASIAEALADPVEVTDEELDSALEAVDGEMRAQGYR